MSQTTFYLFVVFIELGIGILALLGLLIHEISLRHPQPFKLPAVHLGRLEAISKQKMWAKDNPSWFSKLRNDITAIYKITSPEFYQSPDGNILYVSVKGTSNWTPEQITLWLLAHKPEFIQQLNSKDPAAFDAFTALVKEVAPATIGVSLEKLQVLPKFTRNVLVWKLPLIDLPETTISKEIVIKEI